MKLIFIFPLIFLSSVCLSGCSSIPIMSMVKLSQLDPLSADPHNIRIAIRTTNAVGLQKGDVRMTLGYVADDNSLIIDDLYLVEVTQNHMVDKELLEDLEHNESVTIMHLSETDAKQMRRSQQLIAQRKANDLQGKGSFGIGIHGSCLKTDLPADKMLVDIFIQTEPNNRFFAITEDLDLFQQDGIENLQDWPKCADAN